MTTMAQACAPIAAPRRCGGSPSSTSKTNGEAERVVQTALREWAYAKAHKTSEQRAADLPIWLYRYNWHRPHGSLKSKPISRLGLTDDNLLRLHI
ncbi:putative transposase [Sinorhizobium fredii]|uniref:Integrase catalytic region n=2 Tax=Rhizobium fredii TaxID=380 RepID=I3X7B1_SINF2|nr:integrase catalytic region [Sinorhizobium fredii USDA 257]AFL51767.1 integrase catalytic region [Sinorhizobium fredii USDA 257]